MAALKNYADVQNALNTFVQTAGVTPGGAPHKAFWNTMSYNDFTTGDVPGVRTNGPWKILIVGDPDNSNIIQILKGVGSAADNFGQMPQPGAPYEPEQTQLIQQLSDWIKAGCPN
jgi:hypothetical protein